jgi:predicted nucleic acid-binding protein
LTPDFNGIKGDILEEMNDRLDMGEIEVITVCLNTQYASSLDDMAAIKFGRTLNIPNFGTIAVLKASYDRKILSSYETQEVITEMRSNGAFFKDMKGLSFEEYYKRYFK